MAIRKLKFPLALLRLLLLIAVLDGARASSRFCQKMVEPLGYGCAEYTVETDDGFVLVLHRLSVGSMMRRGHTNSAHPSDDAKTNGTGMGSDPASNTWGAHSSSNRSPTCTHGAAQGAATSAHPAYPHVPTPFGCRNTDQQPHDSDSLDGSTAEGVAPITSSGSTPAPDTSVSPNGTHMDSSPNQATTGAGPTSSAAQDSSGSSEPQQTINGTSPSNYTSSRKAGKDAPVLLMHMEFFGGDFWLQFLDADQNGSRLLPIMLLEDGFDVWIGHQRATYWGHGHAQLRSTDRAYWNWTWDQHVQYDLPAQLRFISTETNRPVHFVGASQAATVGAAAATDKETARMIRSLTLIGPTVFRGNSNSFLLNAWAYFFGVTLDTTYYTTGFQNGAFNYSEEFPNSGPITGQGISGMTIGLISGPNCCLGSASVQLNNGWDGTTSFKNLLHWQQGIRTNTFQHFDYSIATSNVREYGQPTPPAYNVGQIPSRLPTLIIAGGRDWTAPPEGTNELINQLQRTPTLVNITNYAHFDLYFSVNRDTDVYPPILQFLEGPDFEHET